MVDTRRAIEKRLGVMFPRWGFRLQQAIECDQYELTMRHRTTRFCLYAFVGEQLDSDHVLAVATNEIDRMYDAAEALYREKTDRCS